MSLVNQMLRDLQQRNTRQIKAGSALELQVTPVNANSRGLRQVIMLVLMLAAFYLWQQNQQKVQNDLPGEPVVVSTPGPIIRLENTPTNTPLEVSTVTSAYMNINRFLPTLPLVSQNIESETEKTKKKFEFNAPEITPSSAKQPDLTEKKISKPVLNSLKTRSPHEQAESLYQQAQTSVSLSRARDTLQQALQLDEQHLPARSLLLKTLLKLEVPDEELYHFVVDSLQLFPGNPLFIKTGAHLFIQQKNYQAAVNILEQVQVESRQDSSYLSLLAASYQQLHEYQQAASIYEQLTSIQSDKAEHWLGLAIAQDNLNLKQSAIQAYRFALDKHSLNTEVVDFINERLNVLN